MTNRLPSARMSPVSKKWVRVFLGLAVTVPVALLPLFGKLHIPPFEGLLALLPISIQKIAIPLSCAAMAVTAISVEFRVIAKASKEKLLAESRTGIVCTGLFLVAFCISYSFLVTEVHFLGGAESSAFVTGLGNTSKFPCTGMDAEGCVRIISTDESEIASYFGDFQVRASKALLIALYVGFFASFGNLAGILVCLQSRPSTSSRRTATPKVGV